MNRKIFLFLALASLRLQAFAGQPGTASMNFLEIGAGPRAVSMGEGAFAQADDAFAATWNPAGLAQVSQGQSAFLYNQHFQDMSQQYFTLSRPLGEGQGLGFSLTRFAVKPFNGYNAMGDPTGSVDSSDLTVGAAYGRTFRKDFSLGVQGKYLSERLESVKANTFAMDLGALYNVNGRLGPWSQGMKAGAVLRNLGPGVKFRRETFPLPRSLDLGLAYGRSWAAQTINVILGASFPKDDGLKIGLGAEYWMKKLLALRLGYRTGQDEGIGLRAGLGFRVKMAQVDYSVAPFDVLGMSQQISFSLFWGKKGA